MSTHLKQFRELKRFKEKELEIRFSVYDLLSMSLESDIYPKSKPSNIIFTRHKLSN